MIDRPTFDTIRTRYPVQDITEPQPIPAGATVLWADYDSCADLYFVEYRGRIYAAAPEELGL